LVSRSNIARAVGVLESHDLPHAGRRGLGETFGKSGLLPSATEERARYAAAMSSELEHTLEDLPNVVGARVHLALPAENPIADLPAPRPTASVLLRTRGKVTISETEVKKLVAGAVHTLQPDDVSVVLAPAANEEPEAPFERMGPLQVAKGSRTALGALLIGGLGTILLLGGALLFLVLRLVSLRRQLRAPK
jgi:type III secretion protein J